MLPTNGQDLISVFLVLDETFIASLSKLVCLLGVLCPLEKSVARNELMSFDQKSLTCIMQHLASSLIELNLYFMICFIVNVDTA